jgi:dolichyl-diphosphooligosaccharide--protein glycosyltransferase
MSVLLFIVRHVAQSVLVVCPAFAFMQWVSTQLPRDRFMRLLRACLSAGAAFVGSGLLLAFLLGKLQWSGRSLTLLDPTYASKYIPIIASVGEHQPTVWSAYYFSLGPAMLFIPLGVYYSFQKLDAACLFMIVYSTFAFYFSGIMVRLLLTLAPAACYLSAVGASGFMHKIVAITRIEPAAETPEAAKEGGDSQTESSAAAQDEEQEDPTKSHFGDLLSAVGAKLRFQGDAESGIHRAPRPLQLLVFACGVRLLAEAVEIGRCP